MVARINAHNARCSLIGWLLAGAPACQSEGLPRFFIIIRAGLSNNYGVQRPRPLRQPLPVGVKLKLMTPKCHPGTSDAVFRSGIDSCEGDLA